jgi:hypothetical protein
MEQGRSRLTQGPFKPVPRPKQSFGSLNDISQDHIRSTYETEKNRIAYQESQKSKLNGIGANESFMFGGSTMKNTASNILFSNPSGVGSQKHSDGSVLRANQQIKREPEGLSSKNTTNYPSYKDNYQSSFENKDYMVLDGPSKNGSSNQNTPANARGSNRQEIKKTSQKLEERNAKKTRSYVEEFTQRGKRKGERSIKGLLNLGNTCYM